MKKQLSASILVIFALIQNAPAMAATVIETRESQDGDITTMTVEGTKARLQSGPETYLLVDLEKKKFLSVDLQSQQIIDLSILPQPDPALQPSQATDTPVKSSFIHRGAGPMVAGYQTEHYQIMANGHICADTYLAKDTLQTAGIQSFLEGFRSLYLAQKAAHHATGADYDPCEEAQDAAWSYYPERGLPMKTVAVDGNLRQEVVSLRANVHTDEGFFDLPAGLSTKTSNEADQPPQEEGHTPKSIDNTK